MAEPIKPSKRDDDMEQLLDELIEAERNGEIDELLNAPLNACDNCAGEIPMGEPCLMVRSTEIIAGPDRPMPDFPGPLAANRPWMLYCCDECLLEGWRKHMKDK